MFPAAASTVGQQIAAARQRRGLARKTLADLVGRSEEWLRQIEKGQRRLDSIECAVRIADVLRMSNLLVELGLLSNEEERPTAHLHVLQPVREALVDSVTTLAFATQRATWKDAERTLDSDVEDGWGRWRAGVSRYTRTVQMLPRIIRGATARMQTGATTAQLTAGLTAYQLASSVLIRMGEDQLAWLAADRSFRAAERDGTPGLLAAAAWHVSRCHLQQGSLAAAGRFAQAAADYYADRHIPGEARGSARILVGALRLVVAEAAAGMLDTHRAEGLLDEAKRSASAMDIDETTRTVPFGPTEVGMTAVRIAIQLGHSGEALRLAGHLEVPEDCPADSQARHYLPLAYLHARRNEDAAAVFALNKIAAISPEDIRYDATCHRALLRLLRRNNQMVRRELGRLARLAGMI